MKKFFVITALFFVAASALPGSAEAATLAKPSNKLGLVGYWSFNEGTSTKAHDFSGNGNTGSFTNSPGWAAGKYSFAVDLTGGSKWVDMGNPSSLQVTGSLTISAWVNTTSTGQGGVVSKWYNTNGSRGYRFFISATSGVASLSISGDGTNVYTNSSSVAVNDGRWHHVVGIYDASAHTMTVYVDGVANTPYVSAPSSIFSPSRNLNIGTSDTATTGNTFNGKIDDVRVYSRALSATEVSALYTAGGTQLGASQTKVTNGLVGWWTLDGADVTDKVYDRSGNSNNGYFIGGATSTAKTIGKMGQALSFGGATNYVSLANSSSLNITGPVTISVWIFPSDFSSTKAVLGKSVYGNNSGYQIETRANGVLRFLLPHSGASDDYWDTPSFSISAGAWHHVVATADGTNIHIYVDGVDKKNVATSYLPVDSSSYNLYIGAYISSNYFKGSIDDTRIYNRALSASEVKQIYSEGGSKVGSSGQTLQTGSSLSGSLVGYWPFDGLDVTDKVYDRSGQANNGYFIGGATTTAKAIGKIGQALAFGSGSYVGLSTAFGAPSTLTISAWFKTVATGGAIFGQSSSLPTSAPSSFVPSLTVTTTGTLRGELWTGTITGITSTGSVNDGVWHQAVLAGNTSTQSLYLDGVLVGTRAGTIQQAWWSASEIGTGYDSSSGRSTCSGWCYFNGRIDDVRVYNRALSASEIKQLYNLGK